MAQNEGEKVTSHVIGSASPFMGVALAEPMGVIGMFALIVIVSVLFAIYQGLKATMDVWGPVALVALAAGTLYACHRWLWDPEGEDPRIPRLITGTILAVTFTLVELCTGRAGILVGDITGFNPEEALMEVGFPVTASIREAILDHREDRRQAATCIASFRAGSMNQGTSRSVDWAMDCRRHISYHDQRKSCILLDAKKGNTIDYVNEEFCRSIDVWVDRRGGANPSR